jgi:hypothetical protein
MMADEDPGLLVPWFTLVRGASPRHPRDSNGWLNGRQAPKLIETAEGEKKEWVADSSTCAPLP